MSRAGAQEASMVQVSRHGGGGHVAEVALDRPDALNAISTAMAQELSRVMVALAADDTVRAVVLSSTSSRAFCVGADLKERHGMSDADLSRHRDITRGVYASVLALPMPAVAAIEGFALGGGLELALSCDLIVAGQDSVVGLPEVSVGVIPGGGGTQLLTRRVGWSRAASMIFTARRIDARHAEALGVVDEVRATGAARASALELAETISRNSPVGVRMSKRAMRLGSDVDLSSGLEIEDAGWRATAFSADRAEGIAAFQDKRSPRWPGEGGETD